MDFKRAAGMLSAVILVLSFQVQAFAAAKPGVLTGVTTGRQEINDQDIPGARQLAVENALGLAVQNAFASLVSRQVFASNLEFLYTRLLARTSDYVVTYRVLDGIEHNGHYIVGVESKINLKLLKKRLSAARILNTDQNKPVILFLIAEQTPEDLLPRYWWANNPQPYFSLAEDVLKARMGQEGFVAAHTGGKRPDPFFYNIRFDSIYDAEAAMALGRALKADMVVLGRAGASESFNRMGDEKAFDAVISLDGYDLASGTRVVHTRSQAAATSQMEDQGAQGALAKAAEFAAQDLGQEIDAFWSKKLRKESSFEVLIEGNDFLPRFLALKKRFHEIRDIENMQPKEIGSENAVMEIVYKGSPQQFADAVLLKTFDGFGIEIAQVSEEQVVILFVDEQPVGGSGGDISPAGGEKTEN